MDDTGLDAIIDDVAREMTAGEPDASFRARVLDRIESGSGIRDSGFGTWGWSSGRGGRWRSPLAGLAAAALIVAAVVLFRGRHERAVTVAPIAHAPAMPAAPAERPTGTERPVVRPPVALLKPDTTAKRRTDAAVGSTSEIDTSELAPPPLHVSPLDVESIALAPLPLPDSIRLDYLEPITPIAVVPLGQGDRP